MRKVIERKWGYAVVDGDTIWIPAVMGKLRLVLDELYRVTGIKKMIFSAVIDPDKLRSHLRNIKREWDAWFEEAQDVSHCIEIEYVPDEAQPI